MKLRKGRARYKIPAHSQILDVRIEGNQPHNQMHAHMIRIVEWWRMSALVKDLGMPHLCSIQNEIIEFMPSPDKSYIVTVRYTPPVAEF